VGNPQSNGGDHVFPESAILLAALPVGVVFQNADGEIVLANAAAERILGLSVDQMRGVTSRDPRWRTIHVDGSPFPGAEHPAMRALATGVPVQGVVMGVFNPSVAKWVWISITAVPIAGAGVSGQCQPQGVYTIFEDITERKEAEAEIRQNALHLKSWLDTAATGLVRLSLDLRYRAANAAYARLVGRPVDEIMGRFIGEVLGEPALEKVRPYLERGLRGETLEYELEVPIAGAGPRWVHVIYTPDRDAAGEITGLVVSVTDITARHQAEQARRQQAQLIELSFEPIFVWDLEAGIVAWNRGCEELYGYTRLEALGRSPHELLKTQHPIPLAEVVAQLVASTNWTGELRHTTKDGHPVIVESRQQWVHFDGRHAVLETNRDISARKQAELAVRESRQQLALALEAGNLGFWDWDVPSGRVQFGGRWATMLGYDPGEIEPHVQAWERLVHPDDKAAVMATLADHLEGRTDFYECEHRIRHKDGSWRWILDRGRVVARAADGRPLRALGTHADVTARREAEEALRAADRRNDEFLAMLAHELRNPLAPIRNAVQVLRKSDENQPTTRQHLRRLLPMIDRQVHHLVRLVDDLLEVSRISRGKIELRKEPVELASVIGHAVDTSLPLIQEAGHRLAMALPEEPMRLDADPVRLAQVFSNLLNNAARYTPPGGRIGVRAERRGHEVAVSVCDTGEGILADELPRVFDPFTQVSRSIDRFQEGLGLGLALVRSLVELHGGRVEVHSEGLGQGSEFVVYLPLAPQRPDSAETDRAAVAVPPGVQRILVVDDNRDAADSLGVLLEAPAREVRVVYDGPAAITALTAFRPQAIVLDLGMPGLDGLETARRIRQLPEGRTVTLIAVTGWGQDEDRRRTREAGFDHHLVKPVDGDLLQALLGTMANGRDQL
jgi:PAS domain S-box-containing protein